jgi:N-acetyltransferase
MNFTPVTLAGRRVRLEPLDYRHAAELLVAASHDDIWNYLDEPTPRTVEQIRAFITDALDEQKSGRRLPFAIVDNHTETAVGSTSYIDIRPADRGVEIGWTWLTPSRWGTGINREAKYLLLRHAFEDQGAIRVALKTDARNLRSQRAIELLGAVREGVWRNHRILSTGTYRDSVFYSITDSEWPRLRAGLDADSADAGARGRFGCKCHPDV